MALPPASSSRRLEGGRNVSKTAAQETPASPQGGNDEKGEEDDVRPMASFIPPVDVERSILHGLMSTHVWGNHILWRAGVSLVSQSLEQRKHISFNRRTWFQVIEGIASGSLNFVSGLLFATLTTWPRAAIPVGVFFGNAVLVSILVSALAPATGAHINPLVTMATTLSGLCHPVRAIIYIFCQLVGGALGGTLLRVALGKTFAYEIHNAGCWIDPEGEVSVWQAALIEFTSVFILLSVTFPFDPR